VASSTTAGSAGVSLLEAPPAPPASPSRRRPLHGKGKTVGLSLVMTYLSVIVLIPSATLCRTVSPRVSVTVIASGPRSTPCWELLLLPPVLLDAALLDYNPRPRKFPQPKDTMWIKRN